MKKLVLLSLAILSSSVLAMPPKPASCPSPAAIQSVGVQTYENGDVPGTWIVGVDRNTFGTPDTWTFGITNIPAANGKDAMKIGQQQLTSIYGGVGPVAAPYGVWECLYSVKGGYWTVAFSPVDSMEVKKIL